MLDEIYFQAGHITRDAFAMLEKGQLSPEEREQLLAHMQNCPHCMDDFMDGLTEDSLMEVPAGLEPRILCAVEEEDEKRKAREKKIIAVKITKLAIAVCLTMVLFTSGVFSYIGGAQQRMLDRQNQAAQNQTVGKEPLHSRKENRLDEFWNSINSGFMDFARDFNSFHFFGAKPAK